MAKFVGRVCVATTVIEMITIKLTTKTLSIFTMCFISVPPPTDEGPEA